MFQCRLTWQHHCYGEQRLKWVLKRLRKTGSEGVDCRRNLLWQTVANTWYNRVCYGCPWVSCELISFVPNAAFTPAQLVARNKLRATSCAQHATCCGQQATCCAQHVASSNKLRATSNAQLVARNLLRRCKRGIRWWNWDCLGVTVTRILKKKTVDWC